MTSGKKSQVLCGFRHLSPLTNGKPRMFAGFLGHLSLFLSSAGGQLVPPYDLKSQKGQIEGIIRFYAASATCQGDKLKWTPTCQGTNCGARMFPGFLLNLSLFLSSAGGQLWLALSVTATPCQRLGYRLGCCLPVADVQHRPTRQRRPAAGQRPTGT